MQSSYFRVEWICFQGELEIMNGSALSDAENNRNSPGRSKTVDIGMFYK